MPIPAIAAAILSTLGTTLAKNGVEVLGEVLTTGTDAVKTAVAKRIEEATGIKLEAAKDGKLTADQVSELAQFERDNIPELLGYLKEAERAHVQLAEIESAERANIRTHDERKKTWQLIYDKFYELLVTFGIGFFLWHTVFLTETVDDYQKTLGNLLVGFLTGALTTIFQRKWGTSDSSSRKQDIIEEVVKKKL